MRYVQVQVYDGAVPIDHVLNKDIREATEVAEGKAKVKYAYGMTINLGDYNSARAEVGIELPADATPEGIEKVYGEATKWVNAKMDEETEYMFELKKAMAKGNKK